MLDRGESAEPLLVEEASAWPISLLVALGSFTGRLKEWGDQADEEKEKPERDRDTQQNSAANRLRLERGDHACHQEECAEQHRHVIWHRLEDEAFADKRLLDIAGPVPVGPRAHNDSDDAGKSAANLSQRGESRFRLPGPRNVCIRPRGRGCGDALVYVV